jgi:hypothetical protein
MAVQYASGKIVTDGLVLALDASDRNSYVSGSTTWYDLSGNTYNGTVSGSTLPTFSTANGGSLSFLGGTAGTSYIAESLIPDSFWVSGSWSISAWVKFNVVNTGNNLDNSVVGHGTVFGTNTYLHICERQSRVHFGFYGNDLTGTIPLSANIFYNIVWVYDYASALKRIYVNSIFDNSGGTVRYAGAGSNTRIGSYSVSSGFGLCLNGNLYNILFYNKVLSQLEITQNYTVQKSRFGLT